jgi:DNA replication licensing factor MCM6
MDPNNKSMLLQRSKSAFLEFLQKYQVSTENGREPEYYYEEQAKLMITGGEHTLYVKIGHFGDVDPETVTFEPADLRTVIIFKYMVVKDALDATVVELLEGMKDKYPELQDPIDKAREKDELSFKIAFHDLPWYCGIRELRTEKLGRLVSVCGTVTRTTERKPELLEGTYQCNDCKREVSGVKQQFKVTMPVKCPSKNCGNRTNWTLLGENKTTRWGDWQRIRVQENESEVPPGSMPRSMDVIVRDEMCERCKAGDKIMVTGALIVVPDVPSMFNPGEIKAQVRRTLENRRESSYASEGVKGLSGMGNRDLTYKLAFFGTFLDEDSDWGSRGLGHGVNVRAGGQPDLTAEDKALFERISKHKGPDGKCDCVNVVARSIAPGICGHLDVKKGILLMLVGGIPKKTDEGIKLRGDINMCLLGDPATAKSAMLKWTSQFLPRAVFASGKASTAAGLTASVVTDKEMDNERVIQPGALMLSDNGVCCIDEFEMMDDKDQVAIHEAMEQQTITLSKAGIQATLNARASILAACLPKNTYYEPTQPVHKNCTLSPPIMSRFDLMFVVQDVRDESKDNQVAKHILNLHKPGAFSGEAHAPELSRLDLQRYIALARAYSPKITPEAHDRLIRCYKQLRQDRTYVRGSSGVTVRQLESLIRLSEAIARVHLDDKVKVEYVREAFDLQLDSLKRERFENIDLGDEEAAPEEAPAEGAAAEGQEGAAGAGAEGAGAAAPGGARRLRITFQEYQRIGQMLARHLARQSEEGQEVKEEDLIAWYMEQEEDNINTEAQLFENQHKVQKIITRMIERDRVIVVYRQSEDPLRPEGRILIKHPNFPVGDLIAEPRKVKGVEQR